MIKEFLNEHTHINRVVIAKNLGKYIFNEYLVSMSVITGKSQNLQIDKLMGVQ